MAQIILTGNVGHGELKFTNNGKAVLEFTVADNLRVLNRQSNVWETKSTMWWRVTVWEKQAEDLAPEVVKGARVVVVGDVHSREYEKDGATRTVYDVKGKTVAVVPRGDAKGGAFSGAGAASGDPWSAPANNTDEAPF